MDEEAKKELQKRIQKDFDKPKDCVKVFKIVVDFSEEKYINKLSYLENEIDRLKEFTGLDQL